MMKTNYQRPPVNYKKRRKSMTIPDQSLTIQQIMDRFVQGIPVNVSKNDGVYLDQDDYDLEKMSRMNFADKSAMSDELRAQAKAQKETLIAKEELETTRRKQRIEKAKQKGTQNPDIVKNLDNTMSDDTKLSNK